MGKFESLFETCKASISEMLSARERICLIKAFKIGKTVDLTVREKEYVSEGWLGLNKILELQDPQTISRLEAGLIDYFTTVSNYKGKCANTNGGSAGSPDATIIYLAIRDESIDDLNY